MIYFTAPHRVDLRVLVSELVHTLRTRIDQRQIGSRDAARCWAGWATAVATSAVPPSYPLRISGA